MFTSPDKMKMNWRVRLYYVRSLNSRYIHIRKTRVKHRTASHITMNILSIYIYIYARLVNIIHRANALFWNGLLLCMYEYCNELLIYSEVSCLILILEVPCLRTSIKCNIILHFSYTSALRGPGQRRTLLP